jgi:colanic acid/amylovoran biosynthesis protein
MMAAGLVVGLRKRLASGADIYLECDDWHLRRFKEASGDEGLKSYWPKVDGKTRGKVRRLVDLMTSRDPYALRIMSDFDVLIVLGGDDLSETYQRAVIRWGPVHRMINRKCRVIWAGLSSGPFTGIHEKIASSCWSTVPLITRDDNSYNYAVRQLRMRHVQQGRCFAFVDLPGQSRASSLVTKYGLGRTNNLVFVPSGLVHQYTSDETAYTETWRQIIDRMSAKYPDHKIVLLSHVLLPERCSDKRIITHLMESADKSVRSRIRALSEPMQLAEARAILGCGRYVVTGRMHAAVSSCCMGVPPICLAYSEKFFGVIGRGMGLYDLANSHGRCNRKRKWAARSVVDDVLSHATMIDERRQGLVAQVATAVAESRKMVEQQLAFIEDCIRDRGM